MKKKEQDQKEIYEIDDFEKHCHLWNIIPGGNDNSAVPAVKQPAGTVLTQRYSGLGG